ncbi:hypothetical protein D5086_006094 [Populus alba]|uniref:Uncharacterized protein n=1 Tax=Populus alba TaxID=43335 RepID=A0ACC4CKZ8_POPAL
MVQAQARIFALHSNSALVRGENTADSVTIDELYIGDTVTPPTAGKPLSNMKMPPSVVSSIPSSQSPLLSGRELRSTTKSTEPPPLHRFTLFSESLLKTVVKLLLSIMQFGGQHLGGLGVPAVAMAFPGYVALPK